MKSTTIIISIVVLFAIGLGAAVYFSAQVPKYEKGTFEYEYVTALNKERVDKGMRPLRRNLVLEGAAKEHVKDMIALDYGSAVSPSGLSYQDRAIAAGYPKQFFMGASIGRKYKDGLDFLHDMKQPIINDRNIFFPAAQDIGIYAEKIESGYVVVAMYGSANELKAQ